MRPKLFLNWCRKLSYKISTQANVERKAKKIAPMMFELAKLNLISSVLLQDTTTYTSFRRVMKFPTRRYKINLILSIKLMCLMRRSCPNRSVEICVKPRNCRRTWNILVVVFLNYSCEINFRAPSSYR